MSDYLDQQHKDIDRKILALLERLTTAVRAALQETATSEKLTPIQVEVLKFLEIHSGQKVSISELVKQFQVAQPTMSDVVRLLNEKRLIASQPSGSDARVKISSLTTAGRRVAKRILIQNKKLLRAIESVTQSDRELLFEQLLNVAHAFRRNNLITVDKMCLTCRFFEVSVKSQRQFYCRLLNVPLDLKSVRVDCPEHESVSVSV